MRPAVAHQERPQTAFDMRQVQRELDGHADQLELQERINTAENLPLGPNEGQHDHGGKVVFTYPMPGWHAVLSLSSTGSNIMCIV